MPSLARNIWRPAAYHGRPQSRGYFEGWYFKLIDPTERHRLAVIPGVFLGEDPATSHAFVQTLDGVTGRTTYHRFALDEFCAAPAAFDLAVGPNRFTGEGINLKLDTPERQWVGSIRFGNITPWPVTWRSPGIMDWYSFMPFMECYHGVLSFDHELRGLLAVDGQVVDFHGGRGYIEKDWGQAFPRAWIWLQTNHFGAPGTCLTASVARIPWLGSAFRGFIAGFWWHGRLYRFATYTGARIERLEVTRDHVFWALRGTNRMDGTKNEYRLELIAHRDEEGVDLLHAPYRTAMLQRVLESLTAQVDVRLARMDGGRARTLFTGTGRHAGLEIGGAIEEIL